MQGTVYGGIKMLKLRKCSHKDLEKYYSLFEVDFDSEELLPKLSIHRAMLKGEQELLAMYDEESGLDVACALVCTKSLYGYVLLKYFSVFPWYRDRGFGVEAMRLINKRYADKQGIIAEITEFEDDYPNHIKKLFKFFARFGYVEIKSDYRIGGTTAHVFVKPIKGTHEIEPVYHRIISEYYSRCLNPFAMDSMIDIRPV